MSNKQSNHDADKAALEALVAQIRAIEDLRQHAIDIREPAKVLRDLDKRLKRKERQLAKAAKKLVLSR